MALRNLSRVRHLSELDPKSVHLPQDPYLPPSAHLCPSSRGLEAMGQAALLTEGPCGGEGWPHGLCEKPRLFRLKL
jgi:hypothetical protein